MNRGLFDSLKETYILLKLCITLKVLVAKLRDENRELKEQQKVLKKDKKDRLVFLGKEGVYYYPDDTDRKYPYCPACYETANKRVRLHGHTLKCPACHNDFRGGKA